MILWVLASKRSVRCRGRKVRFFGERIVVLMKTLSRKEAKEKG